MLLSKLARRLLIPCCRNPGDEELQDRRLWTCSTNISVCMAMLSHCVRNGWRCSRRTSPTPPRPASKRATRSEEHTSELQSLMRISYAVVCLKKKNNQIKSTTRPTPTHN